MDVALRATSSVHVSKKLSITGSFVARRVQGRGREKFGLGKVHVHRSTEETENPAAFRPIPDLHVRCPDNDNDDGDDDDNVRFVESWALTSK